MCDYRDIFRTPDTQNWFKCSLAVKIAREGLVEFVKEEIDKFQNDCLQKVYLANHVTLGTQCMSCTTSNVLPCPTRGICNNRRGRCVFHTNPHKPCPNQICDSLRPEIELEHRFRGPSWKNVDAKGWCFNSWELAKCFMPPDGYSSKTITSTEATDFNGIINVLINCKRFDSRFDDDLSQDVNLCTKAREVGRKVRHCADLEIDHTSMQNNIDTLVQLLEDSKVLEHDIGATAAREKLAKLKNDCLAITTADIKSELDGLTKSAADEISQTMSQKVQEFKDQIEEKEMESTRKRIKLEIESQEKLKQDVEHTTEVALSDFKTEVDEAAGTTCTAARKEMYQVKRKSLEDVKQAVKEVEAHAVKEVEAVISKLPKYTQTHGDRVAEYEQKKQELSEDLANLYQTRQSTMPLSPIMPENDDNLTKFYVPFKMHKVNAKVKSMLNEDDDMPEDTVNSYESIFYSDRKAHNNIYIQGEPGMGKSTFSRKLALIWSENKSKTNPLLDKTRPVQFYIPGQHPSNEIHQMDNTPSKNENGTCTSKGDNVHNRQDDMQVFSDDTVVKQFDFVFSLSLQNAIGECEIENMIESQIISQLPDHRKYDGLVPTILAEERCLIILDGLDEWSHQQTSCKRAESIPHRKTWLKTTVITSTRPWKMNHVRICDSELDTLIQISGVTDSELFIRNVLKCLNDKYNTKHEVEDFLRLMEHNKLNHFLNVPIVSMQLLCLWHSDHELGDSQCTIYSNMLDMLFGRMQEKFQTDIFDSEGNSKMVLPSCFENTIYCEENKILLDGLGSLAFDTLHSRNREASLVFSESIVKKHINPNARKTALRLGILSQYKSPSAAKRCSTYSFLHKTFQEFLATYHIYVATNMDRSESVLQVLFQVYGKAVDIMDIKQVFIFVCGMIPELASDISDSIMKSFSEKLDNLTSDLEQFSLDSMTESLQEMVLTGYKESIDNGHQDPQLALHHVHYDTNISDDDEIYRDRLVNRNINKIMTLCAFHCTVDVEKMQEIFTKSSHTLLHVSLSSVEGLTDTYLDLSTITLNYLVLFDINTPFDIQLNTSGLLYCELWGTNKEVVNSVLYALIEAPKLHTLDIKSCNSMSLLSRVLPTLPMLHCLHVHSSTCTIPASLCHQLVQLSKLQKLTLEGICEEPSILCQALPKLSNLQYIELCFTDLGDMDILLPISIKEINLQYVTLTCRSCRTLVKRLTQIPHQVACTWEWCTVTPVEEHDTIIEHLEQPDIFVIRISDLYSDGEIYLQFTKL